MKTEEFYPNGNANGFPDMQSDDKKPKDIPWWLYVVMGTILVIGFIYMLFKY